MKRFQRSAVFVLAFVVSSLSAASQTNAEIDESKIEQDEFKDTIVDQKRYEDLYRIWIHGDGAVDATVMNPVEVNPPAKSRWLVGKIKVEEFDRTKEEGGDVLHITGKARHKATHKGKKGHVANFDLYVFVPDPFIPGKNRIAGWNDSNKSTKHSALLEHSGDKESWQLLVEFEVDANKQITSWKFRIMGHHGDAKPVLKRK